MLESLFGNKSIARVLFFLLINGRCYAGKLARHFKSPLTPFQQALAKLEQLGIIQSQLDGKIRYFAFDTSCPYLVQLESLLRKAYTLLSSQEKKEYYDPEYKTQTLIRESSHENEPLLVTFWKQLKTIKSMTFVAASKVDPSFGWNGTGKGDVRVKQVNDNILVFYENGFWMPQKGGKCAFTNTFRWTLDRFENRITLEHLRFGEHHPVFLFYLTKMDDNTLVSISSHVCKEDSYLGQVRCLHQSIQFNWRIIGPKKNEEIDYVYN